MNEKVDMKEGCERFSFLFATVKWQDNNVILYADVLREYAFWNKNILNYFQIICTKFEDILNEEKCQKVRTAIYEKYAITLFNMAWWCKQVISNEDAVECIGIISERMKGICGGENDGLICQACRAVKLLFKDKARIEC